MLDTDGRLSTFGAPSEQGVYELNENIFEKDWPCQYHYMLGFD